ncbi:MAG TPA: cupin domain-containing protein [Alphaproteobacteria bacterium]|nr:cupin domain-containing protein [Alphaproteobacteria bacterium]
MATVDTMMRPENTSATRSHYIDVVGMPWQATKFPGIEMKVLYADPESGLSTILFRLAPGAEVPLHEHTALEQSYMIEGRLVDHEGECTPGNFVWRPAGSRHIARAPEGAILLSMFMKPNRFAQGQRFFTEK